MECSPGLLLKVDTSGNKPLSPLESSVSDRVPVLPRTRERPAPAAWEVRDIVRAQPHACSCSFPVLGQKLSLLTFLPSVLCERRVRQGDILEGAVEGFFNTCSQHTIIKGKQRRGKF